MCAFIAQTFCGNLANMHERRTPKNFPNVHKMNRKKTKLVFIDYSFFFFFSLPSFTHSNLYLSEFLFLIPTFSSYFFSSLQQAMTSTGNVKVKMMLLLCWELQRSKESEAFSLLCSLIPSFFLFFFIQQTKQVECDFSHEAFHLC